MYRLHRETFYLAVDFIDRYLGVAEVAVPKSRLQLIGIRCLFNQMAANITREAVVPAYKPPVHHVPDKKVFSNLGLFG